MLRLCGAVLVGAMWVAAACAQQMPGGFPERLTDAPAVPPRGCPASLVEELHAAAGTDAYRTLHRELASLKLGHSASQQAQTALSQYEKPGGTARHEHEIVPVMSGLTEAQNSYLCASFLAGQEISEEKSARSQREALISVYNRMALHVWELANALSMEAAASQPGKAASIKSDADPMTALMEERRKAGSDLLDAMTASALRAIEPDGSAGRLTCAERARLLKELEPLIRGSAADEFMIAAGLLKNFLERPDACAA